MGSTATWRETKKKHTRAALVEAAVKLFAERGYDEVTVPDVASAAGVSARTAYRYVSDKAELLFGDDDQVSAALSLHLERADPDMDAVDLVREALTGLTPIWSERRQTGRLRLHTIERSAALRSRARLKLSAYEETISNGLRARGSDSDHAELVGRLFVAAFDHAVRVWLTEEHGRPLVEVVNDVLGRVEVRAPSGEPRRRTTSEQRLNSPPKS